jgi:hypothetical protein
MANRPPGVGDGLDGDALNTGAREKNGIDDSRGFLREKVQQNLLERALSSGQKRRLFH